MSHPAPCFRNAYYGANLVAIRILFDPELDRKRVAAIDAARAAGATWQQIAEAMGYDDRRSAEGWHRRRAAR